MTTQACLIRDDLSFVAGEIAERLIARRSAQLVAIMGSGKITKEALDVGTFIKENVLPLSPEDRRTVMRNARILKRGAASVSIPEVV